MKAKTKKSSLLPFVVVSGIGMVFIIYYSTLTKPLEKILALMVAVTCCLPFIFKFISMMFSDFANQLKKEQRNNPYTRFVNSKGEPILKSDYYKQDSKVENKPKEEKYIGKHKEVTTKGYAECRNIIIASSKNKLLTRKVILELKAKIRNVLGVEYEFFKDKKFANDFNEIFAELKSDTFTEKDYNDLTEWVSKNLKLPSDE
ncbi:hypothetical protein [Thomasclavelia spiroformis]|mgnify:CR=1 FL=1|jgi:hypothetical protein|uniref:hypothetical protein n=1 Tax=Thomasclavelia spiroformis TaxID=29348 RepID=UPI00241E3B91|nr:hypothetical protein [Thomasclavelia spiroformis]